MNENKLFAAAADLDDRFVAETMQKKARPRGVRFIAAATAALILVGAGFAAYKALKFSILHFQFSIQRQGLG